MRDRTCLLNLQKQFVPFLENWKRVGWVLTSSATTFDCSKRKVMSPRLWVETSEFEELIGFLSKWFGSLPQSTIYSQLFRGFWWSLEDLWNAHCLIESLHIARLKHDSPPKIFVKKQVGHNLWFCDSISWKLHLHPLARTPIVMQFCLRSHRCTYLWTRMCGKNVYHVKFSQGCVLLPLHRFLLEAWSHRQTTVCILLWTLSQGSVWERWILLPPLSRRLWDGCSVLQGDQLPPGLHRRGTYMHQLSHHLTGTSTTFKIFSYVPWVIADCKSMIMCCVSFFELYSLICYWLISNVLNVVGNVLTFVVVGRHTHAACSHWV